MNNVFLVGAAKAGTTTVESVLSSNPDVSISLVKEPNFYCNDLHKQFDESVFNNLKNLSSLEDYSNIHSHAAIVRNKDVYEQLYKKNEIRLDASTNYLYSAVAAKNIYDDDQNAKIIIILRDPLKRSYSHWLMDRRIGFPVGSYYEELEKEYSNITDAKFSNSPLYISRSLYYEQVKRYFDLFPRKNIKVIYFEELFSDKYEYIMKDLHWFLGLECDEVIVDEKNKAMVPRFEKINNIMQVSGIKVFVRSILGEKAKQLLKGLVYKKNDIKLDASLVPVEILNKFEEDYKKTKLLVNSGS
ncbi:sulfotransferase domain-containing protein [Amphritea sp. 2_MG-2023]|uniref:sulfotransferase domain-containing protein n=1 Tax=Amphritea TaxID=515417 RepID=UPI001C075463|nr:MULTISPECIES: sulfotransferase domain-containing protein [Amphritea]MBU2964356.1 sulfotransferase domain-containing protein [Amphritea atlantica]MDO6419684.1 sulfotransferase domain-containing protein [Amphritea sp. 2_MG-2023]